MAKTDIGHVIIALGAGLDAGAIGRMRHVKNLSHEYKSIGTSTLLRAAAAAVCYQKHKDAVIVFSGGVTTTGQWISEACGMREYIRHQRRFPVPFSRIFTESTSRDTITNVRRTAALLRTLPLSPDVHFTLIAGRRQMESAVAYFRAHGITVRPMLVREAFGEHVKEFDIPGTVDAPLKPHEKRRERALKFVRLFDRRGFLISAYLRWKRR